MRLTKKILLYELSALAIAFLVQALWETPLRPIVWRLTYIGGWVAWHLSKPIENDNATAWTFDLIAIFVNGTIYFLIIWAIDYSIRLRKAHHQHSA